MATEKTINLTKISLVRDDITLIDVDAFVFYARPDLQLGTGIGNAIAVRGGPKIQEELDKLEKPTVGQALASQAGKLKAKNIIHAVGPAFQEDDTEGKLRTTAQNALKTAEELGVEKLALPAMGKPTEARGESRGLGHGRGVGSRDRCHRAAGVDPGVSGPGGGGRRHRSGDGAGCQGPRRHGSRSQKISPLGRWLHGAHSGSPPRERPAHQPRVHR